MVVGVVNLGVFVRGDQLSRFNGSLSDWLCVRYRGGLSVTRATPHTLETGGRKETSRNRARHSTAILTV